MKKKLLGIGLALSLLFCGIISVQTALAASESKSVDVLFLHDTHSHLNEFATVEDGETQVLGGFAKLMTLVKERKAENPETLMLDAGDFSMGTLLQVVYEEEASELRMLGELGIDVTTFGNHEYDYRSKGLANMLTTAIKSGDKVPEIVVCNVDWNGMEAAGMNEEQKLLWDAFQNYGIKDYTIVEKNGVKIAVIGVFGIDALDCAPTCALTFQDPVEAVKETVTAIKKTSADVDMIACVSHGGVWEDEEESEDEILAKNVPELDLIISGHTHSKFEEPIIHGDTHIVSCSEYGKYLGDLTMTQKEDGRWEISEYELVKVDKNVEADPETQAKIDGFADMVDKKYLEQYGYTKDQVLCNNQYEFATSADTSDLHTELNLGSIMSDAYTYAVNAFANKDDDPNPVDVAVVPAGTIRDTYAVGDLTVENVFNSFSLGIGEDGIPGYPLISVYLTGAELRTVAELDASISDLMSSARLYSDGLYWAYNPNRMILNKATDVFLVNDNEERVELESDKLYRVVTDYYSSQMLGSVTDMSFGLLSIVPKFADGTPIENYADAIIMSGDQELKAWVAIARYMESFEDTDGNGTPDVPEKYNTAEGRKIVEDSKHIGDLLKNPNKFFFMIIGILLLVILLLAAIVWLIVKLIKKMRKRKAK